MLYIIKPDSCYNVFSCDLMVFFFLVFIYADLCELVILVQWHDSIAVKSMGLSTGVDIPVFESLGKGFDCIFPHA